MVLKPNKNENELPSHRPIILLSAKTETYFGTI